jgi:hypothetical protein
MTRSKLELATILAALHSDESTANDYITLSVRRLHYEIQRLEDMQEPEPEPEPEPKPKRTRLPQTLWSRVTLEDSSSDTG